MPERRSRGAGQKKFFRPYSDKLIPKRLHPRGDQTKERHEENVGASFNAHRNSTPRDNLDDRRFKVGNVKLIRPRYLEA